jgi:hypothetical protein
LKENLFGRRAVCFTNIKKEIKRAIKLYNEGDSIGASVQ